MAYQPSHFWTCGIQKKDILNHCLHNQAVPLAQWFWLGHGWCCFLFQGCSLGLCVVNGTAWGGQTGCWVHLCSWIRAVLTDLLAAHRMTRSRCMAYRLKDHVKLLNGGILNRERRCILYIQSDIDKRQQRGIKETLYKRQADINATFKYEKKSA